eukprot:jgi/Chlat1/5894/Chrsp4S06395
MQSSAASALPPPPSSKDEKALPLKLRRLQQLIQRSEAKSSKLNDATLSERRDVDASGKDSKKRCREVTGALDLKATQLKNVSMSEHKLPERKKRFLEQKKKRKRKQRSEDEFEDVVKDHVKFGEIVQQPPKIDKRPRLPKSTAPEAWSEESRLKAMSMQRLREQVIGEYRKKRDWVLRPGGSGKEVTLLQPLTDVVRDVY